MLNAAVTPTLSLSSPDRPSGGNARPVRLLKGTPPMPFPRGRDVVSATLPVTVAAGPKGQGPRMVRASDSSGTPMKIGRPKHLSALPKSLTGTKEDLPTTKASAGTSTFVENKGQWGPQVRFQLKGGRNTIWLTDSGIVFDNVRAKADQPSAEHSATQFPVPALLSNPGAGAYDRMVFGEDFIGGNATLNVEPIDVQPLTPPKTKPATSHTTISVGLRARSLLLPMSIVEPRGTRRSLWMHLGTSARMRQSARHSRPLTRQPLIV
jgi:hypothetical protein